MSLRLQQQLHLILRPAEERGAAEVARHHLAQLVEQCQSLLILHGEAGEAVTAVDLPQPGSEDGQLGTREYPLIVGDISKVLGCRCETLRNDDKLDDAGTIEAGVKSGAQYGIDECDG